MLQREVHRSVIGNASVVAPYKVVEATERTVLHAHGTHHNDMGPRKGIPQKQCRVLQVPFDVILIVSVGFHLFWDVLDIPTEVDNCRAIIFGAQQWRTIDDMVRSVLVSFNAIYPHWATFGQL